MRANSGSRGSLSRNSSATGLIAKFIPEDGEADDRASSVADSAHPQDEEQVSAAEQQGRQIKSMATRITAAAMSTAPSPSLWPERKSGGGAGDDSAPSSLIISPSHGPESSLIGFESLVKGCGSGSETDTSSIAARGLQNLLEATSGSSPALGRGRRTRTPPSAALARSHRGVSGDSAPALSNIPKALKRVDIASDLAKQLVESLKNQKNAWCDVGGEKENFPSGRGSNAVTVSQLMDEKNRLEAFWHQREREWDRERAELHEQLTALSVPPVQKRQQETQTDPSERVRIKATQTDGMLTRADDSMVDSAAHPPGPSLSPLLLTRCSQVTLESTPSFAAGAGSPISFRQRAQSIAADFGAGKAVCALSAPIRSIASSSCVSGPADTRELEESCSNSGLHAIAQSAQQKALGDDEPRSPVSSCAGSSVAASSAIGSSYRVPRSDNLSELGRHLIDKLGTLDNVYNELCAASASTGLTLELLGDLFASRLQVPRGREQAKTVYRVLQVQDGVTTSDAVFEALSAALLAAVEAADVDQKVEQLRQERRRSHASLFLAKGTVSQKAVQFELEVRRRKELARSKSSGAVLGGTTGGGSERSLSFYGGSDASSTNTIRRVSAPGPLSVAERAAEHMQRQHRQ